MCLWQFESLHTGSINHLFHHPCVTRVTIVTVLASRLIVINILSFRDVIIIVVVDSRDIIVTIVTVVVSRDASSSSSSSLPCLQHHHFQQLLFSSSNATSPNLHHHQHYFAWCFIIIVVPPSSLSLSSSSSIGIILHHDFGDDWFRLLTFLVPMGVTESISSTLYIKTCSYQSGWALHLGDVRLQVQFPPTIYFI